MTLMSGFHLPDMTSRRFFSARSSHAARNLTMVA
jgi:hypothetical protein